MIKVNCKDLKIYWSESESEDYAGALLGSPCKSERPTYKSYYGITISLPHTSSFLNMTSVKQAKTYRQIWNVIKNALGIPSDSAYSLEFNEKGNVHLHGWIELTNSEPRSIIGGICDFSKIIHSVLPPKYKNYSDRCLFPLLKRYKCPSHVIQYYEDDDKPDSDPSGIKYWKKYILKDIEKYSL